MKARFALPAALVIAIAAVVIFRGQSATPVARSGDPTNDVLARARDIELGNVVPKKYEQRVSSAPVRAVLEATGETPLRTARSGPIAPASPPRRSDRRDDRNSAFCSNVFRGRGDIPDNVRVNQDCSLRRQAEEVVAVNPTNPNNLIAGQNDSRIGFNHCGYDWSFDGGKTWGDQVPPFWNFLLEDGHTADACADPTVSFDANGNAYIAGILFNVLGAANALVVMKSNAGIGGAYFHSPAPLPFQTSLTTPVGVVASDPGPTIFHDKEFIVADARTGSPKRNNVYVTWTRFDVDTGAGVGGHSPIYFSQSTDGGATWSPGIPISGANAAICTGGFSGTANPDSCDQDQGSDPIVGPDGTVYVSFINGNIPGNGISQHLLVKCAPTNDCANPASWSMPARISTDIGTQPIGPSAEGCPAGRQCLPPNGYRINDFGAVSIDAAGRLYFAWADFRNGGGTCAPLSPAAAATPPCDNDIFYSFSTDGGATWADPINVAPASLVGKSAQWQPWAAVSEDGVLYIGYYDRSYGNCEMTGCNDITLASVQRPTQANRRISRQRITTASMPNLTTATNPVQAGFLGDYMWVTVDPSGKVLLVWGDTRGMGDGFPEEDIYFASLRPARPGDRDERGRGLTAADE
ncbi:MAG: sialidase family protein [Dehalococcoidia bacterium]